jgi:signal transduction histidine kinase
MTTGGDTNVQPRSASGQPGGLWQPLPIALMLGGIYLIFCSIYIWISGHLAAERAETVPELAHLEAVKGIVFVLVCSVLLALLAWRLLTRLAHKQAQLAQNQQALIMTERRAMAGSLASTVAHDMNNILTVGCASAELLLLGNKLDTDQKELVQDINDSFKRMMELAKRLSSMGRAGTRSELQPGDLRQVLEDEVNFARHHERLRPCQIKLDAPESVQMPMNAAILQHMIFNLLLNAAEATQGKGQIEVRVRRERSAAIVEVHDNGPGVPVDQRERIFDAFYTTKSDGQGLGLLSVKAAAQMHRGRALVIESPLGGACFRVNLPLEPTA